MTNVEKESGTPLPLGQLVKMIAPIFIFGVILPFVDMVTDLRMITRLFVGIDKPVINVRINGINVGPYKYCQDNPEECGGSDRIYLNLNSTYNLYGIFLNPYKYCRVHPEECTYYVNYSHIIYKPNDHFKFCQDNPEECWTEREQHPFATMLLGKRLNKIL